MVDRGVIHGRFQVLHLKHMEYVLAAKMRCRVLYVGITYPEPACCQGKMEKGGHGVMQKDNPLTFIERYEMIQRALLEFGVKREEFEIIPFPVNRPDVLMQYAPQDAVYYMGMCSPWDEEKCRVLQNHGLAVEILWERKGAERGITGAQIREMIARGEEWRGYVPKAVARYIEDRGIDQRIKELWEKTEGVKH